MNNITKISIIIPTYNRAAYITRAIDSVFAQSWTEFEVIVVDDGSTDNTRQVLQPYMGRIKYIHQENAGVSAARNTGIRASQCRWIAFIDSDDIWLPLKLACQINFMNGNNAKVCFTNIKYKRESEPQPDNDLHTNNTINGRIFTEPFDIILDDSRWLYVQTMLIERDILLEAGGFDESLAVAEDTQLIFKLAFKTPFAYIYEPHVIVDCSDERKGLTNNSVMANKARYSAGIKILTDAYLKCGTKDKSIIRKLRSNLAYFLSRQAQLNCIEHNSNDAKRLAMDSLSYRGDLKTNIRALGVLLCPWAMRRLRNNH
jgi:glycosyltransferase involved in cell wall biosynthesis